MKIQLKRSNQLEGGKAKEPSVAQMEYGEVAVNYNEADPSLFIKDSADNIVKLKISEGAQVLISDTIPSTTENEPGTLWWNSSEESGQLFILYDDPSGGGGGDAGGPKWIEASPSTGGSGSGGAEVLVSETAPVIDDLEEGSLWWNSTSTELQLYVLYNDNGTKKWVEASPTVGDGGSEEDFVNVSGDNMTGDLTLGTDKITLDATDGSAEFASSILVGDFASDTLSSAAISNGSIQGYRSAGDNPATSAVWFGGRKTGTDTEVTSEIFADGSAEFSGNVQIGGNAIQGRNSGVVLRELGLVQVAREGTEGLFAGFQTSNDGNAVNATSLINADGSAEFASSLVFNTGGTRTDGQNSLVGYNQSKDVSFYVRASGSAYFKGNVTSDGTIGFNLEPDNPDNYTTTTDVEGNQTQVYNGPTLDVKERLQNLISRLDSLESDEITDDATSTLLLTTVNNINAQMTKVNNALTAIRTAANAAGTLDQLKTDIAAATADI